MEIRHADLQIEVEEAQDAPAHPVGRHSGQRRRVGLWRGGLGRRGEPAAAPGRARRPRRRAAGVGA